MLMITRGFAGTRVFRARMLADPRIYSASTKHSTPTRFYSSETTNGSRKRKTYFGEPAEEMYKHNLQPPANPISSNEVKLPITTFHYPWQPYDDTNGIQRWFRFAEDVAIFYWRGTKVLLRKYLEARQVKKEIQWRRPMKANRREALYIQSANRDMLKFVPYLIIFHASGGPICVAILGWLLPFTLPAAYQTPSYQIICDIDRNEMRHNETVLIDSIVRDNLFTGSHAFEGKSKFTETLGNLRRVSEAFSAKPKENADSFVQIRLQMLALLSRGEDRSPQEYTQQNPQPYAPLLTNFWSADNRLRDLLIGEWMHLRYLERRCRKLKDDDRMVREFTLEAMTHEELVDALDMRGLSLRAYEEFFSTEQLRELLKAWLQFSETTSNPLEYLLAGPMISFHNMIPSKTSVSPSLEQMHVLKEEKNTLAIESSAEKEKSIDNEQPAV